MIQESDCGVGVEGKVSAGAGRRGRWPLPAAWGHGVRSLYWVGSYSSLLAGAAFSLKT